MFRHSPNTMPMNANKIMLTDFKNNSVKRLRTFVPLCFLLSFFLAACDTHVKEPAVAGSFYPAERDKLERMVDGLLAAAENRPARGELKALIAPHAGYVYSGHVAAYAYRHLRERDVRTVILIGAAHREAYKGASVYTEGSWKTPLGKVAINRAMAAALIDEKKGVRFLPKAFEKEHSLEVQLPFLSRTLEDFTIVPVLIGMPTRESFLQLKEKLIEILKRDEKAIIVASTDLSHYFPYDRAVSMDRAMTDAVTRMSLEDVERHNTRKTAQMCGHYAVLLTMSVVRELGATNGVLYKYANSGDVTGDRQKVVGYAAMGLYKSALTGTERARLVEMARETIVSYVKNKKVPDFSVDEERLKADGATFVTINRKGRLRGCIGNIAPDRPLFRSVVDNAVSACSKDGRFRPMSPDELSDMEVEVTILSPLEYLADVRQIEIGKHGLYLEKGRNRGILLPQVATEQGWDRDAFLKGISRKAGLPQEGWKGAKLYTFTADIVREDRRP